MKKECSHIFTNDGGNGLVCKKCGQTISVRTYSMIAAMSLVFIGIRYGLKMQFRQARNTLSNAWCCFKIGQMDRHTALDMMSYACRKRNTLENERKDSGNEKGFIQLVKMIWGF